MPRPEPISDAERAELRRLYLAASPARWEVERLDGQGMNHLYAVRADGTRRLLAMPNRAADAELAAAARNALPRLFAEIDELRRRVGVPILGDVVDGGRVVWRRAA